jgi:hypothetical protein
MRFNPKSVWKAIREIQEGSEGHQIGPADMKMELEKSKLGKSDADNAKMMRKHFTKVFNSHHPINVSVLDKIEQRGDIIQSLSDSLSVRLGLMYQW